MATVSGAERSGVRGEVTEGAGAPERAGTGATVGDTASPLEEQAVRTATLVAARARRIDAIPQPCHAFPETARRDVPYMR
ncbi:hypothetical protein GCM10010109_01090 [Actinoplanes campanulatus]|nr:hypothetical protein GCM10010109_01090 [Actinoplanes campanulatus]